MSQLVDFELKERVRAAVDLVDLVGSYLELRRQGRAYVARCPWHDDRRPSLTINPERQTWRCWVCDIGGDAFSFIMRRDGVSFPEALRQLAERAGIAVDLHPGRHVEAGGPEDRAALLRVVAWAEQQFFAYLERDAAAEGARRYLAERGIDEASRERFRIGFAPDAWQWLLDRAGAAGFAPELLEASGLAIARERGGHYDRFRGRLMFPIRDLQGRPIAFGGRVLPSGGETSGAKYINSPETLLFSKSSQLYGLDLARDAIRRDGNVLVVEGYTDVVAVRQHGIEPVVAVLGTALGERHIRLLKRFTDRVTLVLDGDAAGQRRTDEVLELFLAADIDLRVMALPEGKDPADFVEAEGVEAFAGRVAEAPDAIDHKLQRLTGGVDLTHDTHRATSALEAMLVLLSRVPAERGDLRRQQIIVRLGRTFGVPDDVLRQRLAALSGRRPVKREAPVAKPADERLEPLTGFDRELFELMIEAPEIAPRAIEAIDPAWLSSDTARQLIDVYQRLELAGSDLSVNSILLAVDDERLKGMIVAIDERVQERTRIVGTQSPESLLAGCISRYREMENSRATHRKLADLETSRLDAQEELEVLKQMFEAGGQRYRLPGPSGR